MIIALGTVAASVMIFERDGASITGQNHRKRPQDLGNGQDIQPPFQGLIDKRLSAFADPLLCVIATGILLLRIMICLHITSYLRALA